LSPQCLVSAGSGVADPFRRPTQLAKLRGRALITDDGEANEGVAGEEVKVIGRMTFFINLVIDDDPLV